MVLRIGIIIGLILMISPIQAQRLLGGEKGIQASMGTTNNINKAHSFQLGMTNTTRSGNYWKFSLEYQRRPFAYKKWQLPYELYSGNIGYFFKTLSNYRKSLLVYLGISGLAGYEVFNKDKRLLKDGAILKNRSGFVYGGKGTLSLEVYLSNRWVLFVYSEGNYLPKSGLSQWQSGLGMGIRFFIN